MTVTIAMVEAKQMSDLPSALLSDKGHTLIIVMSNGEYARSGQSPNLHEYYHMLF